MSNTKIEIFCGTGGVGKTTLAVAKAFALAEKSKVLVITIDPSSRLKDYLGLNMDQSGDVLSIKLGPNYEGSLDALLMCPQKTLRRLAGQHNLEQEYKNRIIDALSRPYGGMNEIVSMIELAKNYKKDIYDYIILDTPPGGHFVDFLESGQKINAFFDNSFIEIFKMLKRKNSNPEKSGLFKKLVGSGIKRMLGYLEQMTGSSFIEEFVDAINTIFKSKSSFLEALEIQKILASKENGKWFVVTSTDHYKLEEASDILGSTSSSLGGQGHIIINKCLDGLYSSTPHPNEEIAKIEETFRNRELTLKKKIKEQYDNVLFFPEILGKSVNDHIIELSEAWKRNELT